MASTDTMGTLLPSTSYASSGHKRAHSDATTAAIPPYRPNPPPNLGGLSKISNALPKASPSHPSNRSPPPSRIPVSRRRTSLTSDSGSSVPSSRAGSALGNSRVRGESPVAARNTQARNKTYKKENEQPQRPTTPQTKLSVKRYDASPKKVSASSPSLKAYISAPMPKKSPPLRSSRPRQPVSAASTSSSRAKISERFGATTGRPYANQKREPSRPRQLRDIGDVDLASRRARIEKAMSQKIEEDDLREAAKQAAEKATRTRNLPSKTQQPLPASGTKSTAQVSREPTVRQGNQHVPDSAGSDAVPALSVTVDGLPKTQPEEPTTGATEFETDESPILGMPGSFVTEDRKPSPPPQLELSTHTLRDPPLSSSFDNPYPANKAAETNYDGQMGSSRRGSRMFESNNAPNGIPGEYGGFFGGDDSESIRIMLGATPALERGSAGFANSNYTNILHKALGPHSGSSGPNGQSFLDDEQNHSGDSTTDLDSLHPSDSASIAHRNNRSSMPPAAAPNSRRLTLDAESVSTINRLLGQFYDSGHATPAFLKDFQREVAKASPELARKLDSEPEQAIQAFFEGLFQEPNATLADFDISAENDGRRDNSHATNFDTDDNESLDEPPGTAIIYPTTGRYSDDPYSARSSFDLQSTPGAPGRTDEYRPPPPPKDSGYAPSPRAGNFRVASPRSAAKQQKEHDGRAAAPSMEGKMGDLGLAIQVRSGAQDSPTIPDTLPPLPAHQPPAPPSVPANATDYQFDPVDRDSPISHNVHNVSILPDSLAHTLAPSPGPIELSADDKSKDSLATASTQGSPTRRSADRDHSKSPDKQVASSPDQQRLKQRLHVIQEIVTTENTYCRDMTIVEDIYKATASACKDLTNEDVKGIFGNSDKVLAFTEEFQTALRTAVKPVYSPPKDNRWRTKRGSLSTSNSRSTDQSTLVGMEIPDDETDRKTRIGQVFNEYMPRMEKVYQDYVLNYFYVEGRLQKLEQRAGVSIWLKECHEYARDITDAWNLPTLLIKPSQRILKYPLLLMELLKVTPEDHPDHEALKQAKEDIKKTCDRIDAAKERSILIDQVANRKRKDSDVRMGLTKAFARRTEKLKQQVGLSDSVEDWEYRKIEQKYGGHVLWNECVRRDADLWVKDLYSNVERYNALAASLEAMIDVCPSQNPEIESKWRKFAIIVREITSIAVPEHIAAIGKNVYSPVEQLNKILQHVSGLMEKRKKRILDYAKYKAISDRGDKMDKKTAELGRQWMALNDTLKDELPKLYPLIKKTCRECGLNLTRLMMEWHYVVETKLRSVLEESQIPKDISQIEPAFKGDHDIIQAQVYSLGICNGSLLADSSNFLSPTTTMRTGSLGEASPMAIPELSSKFPGASTFSPFPGAPITTPTPGEGPPQPPNYRYRANSNVSSRGPATPATPGTSRNLAPTAAGNPYFPPRPSTSTGHHNDLGSPEDHRLSAEWQSRTRPHSGSNSFVETTVHQGPSPASTPAARSSAVFSSAMPMPDSPRQRQESFAQSEDSQSGRDMHVLFLAASLFEFNIDRARREGGYPYLTYVAGEVR
jgi:dynamin-binding protein